MAIVKSNRQKRPSVRLELLSAAERLYAEHGLNGVSLRQISAEAGTRNNYAVQSHFGDAEGLISAVIEHRAPQIELRRAELLAQFVGTESMTVRQLLEALYLPIIEPSKPGEPAIFARLHLALLTSARGWVPLDEVYADKPVTRKILELILAANSHVAPSITWRRIQYASVALLAAVISAYSIRETDHFYEVVVADAFDMTAGAITAPGPLHFAGS